ncbi:LHFPL tetraspan subfamily member 2 protein-like [Styela clava]
MCCFVIVTCRTLLWSLLSISVCMVVLTSLMSAHWLVSPPYHSANASYPRPYSENDVRALGLIIRCTETTPENIHTTSQNCRVYPRGLTDFASPFWAISTILMGLAILILTIVALFSVAALCFRSLGKKSIFSVSGFLQGIAGLLLLISLVLFPAGWGSDKVKYDCGIDAQPFGPGSCYLGWSFYAALAGMVGSFLCAFLSHQAEASADSDKVENDILDGKNPVCAI